MLKSNTGKFLSSDLSVFIFFFIFWFFLFRFTGSFTKGYNVAEDFTIIKICQELKNSSIFEVTLSMLKSKIVRFCPLGELYRIVSISIFGLNLSLYTFYVLLFGIFTSFFSYKFCRISSISFFPSLLFGILIFAGPYVIIWSEIADFESLALLLLSLALFFAAKSIYSDNNNAYYKYLFAAFLILSIFCKEVFSVIIPGFIFLYVMMYSSKYGISILQTVKENFKFILGILVIMILFLLYIKYFIGINKQSYTGVDLEKITVKIVSDFFKELIRFKITYLIIFGIIILIASGLSLKDKNQPINENLRFILKNLMKTGILCMLILIPQFIVYYKTGLQGRYLMPFMFGFIFTFIYILDYTIKSKTINPLIKYIYFSIILVFLVYEIKTDTVNTLVKFSKKCQSEQNTLNEIVNHSEGKLLFVMDPVQDFHEVFSCKTYIDYFKKENSYSHQFIYRDIIYPYFSDTAVYNSSFNYSKHMLGNSLIDSSEMNSEIKCILILSSSREKFLKKNQLWFNENDFREKKIGIYNLYFRK